MLILARSHRKSQRSASGRATSFFAGQGLRIGSTVIRSTFRHVCHRDHSGSEERHAMTQGFQDMRFLTVAEVAETMRVSRMTVYRLVHAGSLPAIRFGRSFRVPEAAVLQALTTPALVQQAEAETQAESGSSGISKSA